MCAGAPLKTNADEKKQEKSEPFQRFEIYVFKKKHRARRPVWYQFGYEDCQTKAIKQARLLNQDDAIERVEIHYRCNETNCANDSAPSSPFTKTHKPLIMRKRFGFGLENAHEVTFFILAVSISAYILTSVLL
tara:strand:- start:1011 stop:1409 length:399 start_codon:yes stop_codon:yes gene_type:complete